MNKFNIILFLSVIQLCVAATSPAQINFTEHVIDAESGKISGLCVRDIDGDEDLDVAGTSLGSNTVSWWRNDGGDEIRWTKQTIEEGYVGAIYVHIEDIDGDSLMDILATAATAGHMTWWRNGGGDPIQWTKQTVGTGLWNAHGVYACDLNNDGHKDILGTSETLDQVICWYNSGTYPIEWTQQVIDDDFDGTQSVYAVDVDLDGDNDVLGAAGGDNEVALWYNTGGEPVTWEKQTVDSNFGLAHWVYACDVDGDSLPDILGAAFTANDIAWWKNTGGDPISWEKQIIAGRFNGALTVHAEDVDGDGDRDVLGASWVDDDIAWWENNGTTPIEWSKHTIDYSFNGAWPVCTGDLDGDGDIDIIAGADVLSGGGTSAPLTWWENESATGIENNTPNTSSPRSFLHQNSPNPFNPNTFITFSLERDTNVSLAIYTIKGQKVRTLGEGFYKRGSYTVRWGGENDRSQSVKSGVYLYRLKTEDNVLVKKMVLLR